MTRIIFVLPARDVARLIPRIRLCFVRPVVSRRHYATRISRATLVSQGPLYTVAGPSTPSDSFDLSPGSHINNQNSYSAVLQGVLDNMRQYPECIVLTRVGGFYELYFNHAEEYHSQLGLRRSYRETKLGPVAMAGFPFFQLDRYLKILVQDLGKHVAISEEFPRAQNDTSTKNMFNRHISRVVTPGTLVDERFIDPQSHNYLLAVSQSQGATIGLAYMDLSTGDFFTQLADESNVISDIERLQPKEVLSNTCLPLIPHTIVDATQNTDLWMKFVQSPNFHAAEIEAGSLLLDYVQRHTRIIDIVMQPVSKRLNTHMKIDANALQSLEVRQTMRDGAFRGSLLHALNRTVTSSGTRRLKDWLISPSTNLQELEARLDMLQELCISCHLRSELASLLKSSGDPVRVLQRIVFGRGEADDLLAIARSISAASKVAAVLSTMQYAHQLLKHYSSELQGLHDAIIASIDEEGLMSQLVQRAETAASATMNADGMPRSPSPEYRQRHSLSDREPAFTIRPDASNELSSMHHNWNRLAEEKSRLERHLRTSTRMQTLTLKTIPGPTHIAQVRNADARAVLDSKVSRVIASTRSTRSYVLSEWTELGNRIEAERQKILRAELQVIRSLQNSVASKAHMIRANSLMLDELDVLMSLATTAKENGWTRPSFAQSTKIVRGRHPVAEFALRSRGKHFVPNSIDFARSMHLVTGPNMGGKSTFLRQTAVIQILAQIGSFVPAESARLEIVDAIFSRVGTADSLYDNESTFYAEMKETAKILKQATPRSLVIMDEVGRGTNSLDGLAIAYAILCKISQRGCKTLFASHFSQLASMLDISTLCTDIYEARGQFCFTHKIRQGVCHDSHGLKIAQLAGLEEDVLAIASTARADLLT